MANYKHVLVAIDLSPISNMVLKKASQMGEKNKCDISIIHVMETSPLAYGGEFSVALDVKIEHSLEEETLAILQKLAKKNHIPSDHIYLRHGSVKQQVTKMAEDLSASLIVVGSHGHRGLDILLGSRANAILHAARCDVLAVRIEV